jgi:hypothetical protein
LIEGGKERMSKKRRTREKENQRRTKGRFTNKANIYYKDVVAPLERAYKRALIGAQYREAGEIFLKIREAKKSHRHLLMRKEFMRIR